MTKAQEIAISFFFFSLQEENWSVIVIYNTIIMVRDSPIKILNHTKDYFGYFDTN